MVKKKFDQVYQFKITLRNIRPLIWRRIQVPETYSFWDFHVAIQDVMGWEDYHLHRFEVIDPSTGAEVEIGIPDDSYADWGKVVLPDWKKRVADYFSMENAKANYEYDFGDGWEHEIELGKILPREEKVKYPICIAGKRACPPEDCGGIWGYEELLEAIKDPEHEMHEELLDWVGGEFDPEDFDPKKIRFTDPAKRRRISFD